MSDCDIHEVEAQASFTFDVCSEHGETRLTSLAMTSRGIGPATLADALLAMAEHNLSAGLSGKSEVQALLSTQDGERGKKRLLRALAHAILMKQAEVRGWSGGEVATLSLPA